MKWEFPLNNNAGEQGPNDEGVQNFRGKEFRSLAREMCQNSLDERVDENKPVCMEFVNKFIPVTKIPDLKGYQYHIDRCKEYWKENREAQQYLKCCDKCLKEGNVAVLRISDKNTKGLSEPYKATGQTGWKSLVKIIGAGNKGGESGGSYGIGKKAAFLNSVLRMVFYRTQTLQGERACQGIVRSLTFLKDSNNVFSTTSGIGYYGNEEHLTPVESLKELDELQMRNESGTDIFIYGFKTKIESKEWDREVVIELLNNFILAFHCKTLQVKVSKSYNPKEDIDINYKTLGGLVGKYGNKDTKLAYEVIKSEKTITETYNFHNMGTLKLQLLIDENEKYNRKILISRKSKMTLFYLPKSKISSFINYTGILELEGTKLNEFFRKLETPAHDKWDYKLYEEDKVLAKQYYDEIIAWIKRTVEKYGYGKLEEQVNVEGLNSSLQEQDGEMKENGGLESMEDILEDVTFGITEKEVNKNLTVELKNGSLKSNGKNKAKGSITNSGSLDAIRIPKGGGNVVRKAKHRGEEDPSGKDIVKKKNLGEQVKHMGKVRVLKDKQSEYSIIMEPRVDFSRGNIEILAIGENGKGLRIPVVNAVDIEKNKKLVCRDGIIQIGAAKEDSKLKIRVQIPGTRDYAMEVRMYVHR